MPAMTPQKYLEMERQAERRSEYHDGVMLPMPGANLTHGSLVVNVVGALYLQLRARACAVFCTNMRVSAGAHGPYLYPDVGVVCGEPRFADDLHDTLLNPALVVEVLSPSTECYDRGRTFEY